MRVSGTYPWTLGDGFTTVLHLKNTVNKAAHALVQVRYEGGTYNLERIPLAAFQTVAIDIKSIRDSQQKDIRDSLMPINAADGQVIWFEEDTGSLIGRAEVASIPAGIASSFSCSGACGCQPSYSSCYMTPSSSNNVPGETCAFTANEMRQDCNGVTYGPYNRTQDSSWSSSNTTVATVSAGSVSCLGTGSTGITAQFQSFIYGNTGGTCSTTAVNPTTGSSVSVQLPQLTGAMSALVSGDSNSTISGSNFTLQIKAVVPNTGGRVAANFNDPVRVTFASPDLISGESIAQNPVQLSQGVGSTGVVLTVVDNAPLAASYRTVLFNDTRGDSYATPGTFPVNVWFSVTMDIERWKNCGFGSCPNAGSYFCATACATGGFSQPTAFIALPKSGLCNSGVKVINTANNSSTTTTVQDAGPFSTNNAYWQTGNIPTIAGCITDKLADTLGVSYQCNPNSGQGSILWRFQ